MIPYELFMNRFLFSFSHTEEQQQQKTMISLASLLHKISSVQSRIYIDKYKQKTIVQNIPA